MNENAAQIPQIDTGLVNSAPSTSETLSPTDRAIRVVGSAAGASLFGGVVGATIAGPVGALVGAVVGGALSGGISYTEPRASRRNEDRGAL